MERLAILGASGHGRVVADAAELIGWKTIDFFDDDYPTLLSNNHWQILGDTNTLLKYLDEYDGVIVAIGNNAIRQLKTNQLINVNAPLVNIIHPSAQISQYAIIAAGSVVLANVVVNCDVSIGISAILNTSCTIDHDCILGDYVHVSPGTNLAGNVSIGHRSWVGIGSCVKQGMVIGNDCTIGAGAVVVKNISCNQTVVGNPAKLLSTRD